LHARKGITIMMEHNPDLIDRSVQERQETIRAEIGQSRQWRPGERARVALGMAIIRVGEWVRGKRIERPLEAHPAARRPRYARL